MFKLISTLKKDFDFYAYAIGHGGHGMLYALLTFPGVTLRDWAMQTLGRLVCDHITHKHDWVDESWASPESGGEAGHCKRCGFSFHVTMY